VYVPVVPLVVVVVVTGAVVVVVVTGFVVVVVVVVTGFVVVVVTGTVVVVVVVTGFVVVVVVVVVVTGVPPQVVPLIENDVGAGSLPLQLPLKPMLVEPPFAMAPFHAMLVAVTFWPLWVQFADQPCVTFWFALPNANPKLQLDQASPRFLMVRFALMPPGQSLAWYCTLQAMAAAAGDAGSTARPLAATAPTAAAVIARRLVGLQLSLI